MVYLPPEILFQIFLLLPTKTLVRFLSVSKSWHTLITTKDFVSSHLMQNPCKQNNFLLVKLKHIHTNDKREKFSFYPDDQETTDSLEVPSSTLYSPVAGKEGCLRIVGISNGVICLVDDTNPYPFLWLWNPTIDVLVTLPTPGISREYPDTFPLGFWFDSRNCDFKVMRIVYRKNISGLGFDLPPKGEVYSLNTGEWRGINLDGVKCYLACISWSHVYVHGRSHWIGYKDHCLIVSFDMNDEVVREILLPSNLVPMFAHEVKIVETMGCLAVIGNRGRFCRVWVMKEYEVFRSWNLLVVIPIDLGPNRYRFHGVWKKNGDLLMVRNDHQLVQYAPGTNLFVNLDIFGQRNSLDAGKYQESLALLDLKFSNESWRSVH